MGSDEFTFYWGAASGSARKALRQLNEPNVAINYATKLNQPWDGIDRLFIDSGGYSFMKGMGEYRTSNSAYLDYVADVEPELFALRDYPCEPDIRREYGRTVEDHQRMTTERHADLLALLADRDIDARPVTVLQGWYSDDYLEHLDALRERGAVCEDVAIGTLCGREDPSMIRRIVTTVRDELPSRHRLHAFGVKISALKDRETLAALDSADSQAYDFDERKVRTRGGGRSRDWRDVAFYYLKHKRTIRSLVGAVESDDPELLRDAGQLGLEETA